MVLESTSPLVLRSPVQGRPTIAWAEVLRQGAHTWWCCRRTGRDGFVHGRRAALGLTYGSGTPAD